MGAQYVKFERTGVAIVGRVIPSKVTEREAGVIRDEVAAAAPEAGWRVALDLSEVALLASAGIGTLLTLSKSCREAGGRLTLFGLDEEVEGMMKVTKLDRVLDIRPDRAAALGVFK
ncbi:MAG TPA: STAS domain-containing protein [Phycisphaerales bacterium]|nr:STAS domain-containing protein [Phycisphaerales bacterium]